MPGFRPSGKHLSGGSPKAGGAGGGCGTGKGGFKSGNTCGHHGGPRRSGPENKSAPGRTGEVDHEALSHKVSEAAHHARQHDNKAGNFTYRYAHGSPKSEADRTHLARASAAHKTAIVVEARPIHHVVGNHDLHKHLDPGEPPVTPHPGAVHHVVKGDAVASHHPAGDHHVVIDHSVHTDRASGKVVRDESAATRHKTKDKAEAHAARIAAEHVRRHSSTARYAARDPASFDFAGKGDYSPHMVTTFRVIDP